MYKKILMSIFTVLLILTLTSCNQNHSDDTSSADNKKSNETSSSTQVAQPQNNEIETKMNYKVNNEIEIGNNSDIIAKQGVFKDKVYWRDCILPLGADKEGNFITFNLKTSDIESIDSKNNLSVLLNIMEGRNNHVNAIKKFGDIVAWSECPHGNIDPDETRGANWGLYFTDLSTKKITKIDGYKEIDVPENAQYSYFVPNNVFISPDRISYISWDYSPDGKVTSVIKLYTISSGKLEIIDYLNEDITKYIFGNPHISGDKMVWSKSLINPDGTYTGYSILYDLKTKAKLKLSTKENIINPTISGNYIFAQGVPNKTFYDSEVCIYDISKNEWIYKINNGYSEYSAQYDVNLTNLDAVGNYLSWYIGESNSLVLFNKEDNKLYNIIPYSEKKEINNVQLLDGGLLTWFKHPIGSDRSKSEYKYIFLK